MRGDVGIAPYEYRFHSFLTNSSPVRKNRAFCMVSISFLAR